MKQITILIMLVLASVGLGTRLTPSLSVDRDSVAYLEGEQVAANTARTKTVAVSSHITPEKDAATDRMCYAVDGSTIIGYASGKVYTTTASAWPTWTDTGWAPGQVTALSVVSSGVWLACVNDNSGGVDDPSKVYRTINSGSSWTQVAGIDAGYVPVWSGFKVSNDDPTYVAFCVYGTAQQPTMTEVLGSIYLSTDSGENFTKIFEPNTLGYFDDADPNNRFWEYCVDGLATAKKGLHAHDVCFADGDKDTLYVSYGDISKDATGGYGDQSKIIKLVKNGAAYDWSLIRRHSANPTIIFQEGNYLYALKDGGREGCIERMAIDTGVWEGCLGIYSPTANAEAPFEKLEDPIQFFGYYKYNGIHYAMASSIGIRKISGILVSGDGLHWSWALRENQTGASTNAGAYNAAGYAGGYIWGTYRTLVGADRTWRFTPITINNVTATYVESAMANKIWGSGHFEVDAQHWVISGDYDAGASGRVAAVDEGITAHNGDYVYKIVGSGATQQILFYTRDNNPTRPTNGQYVCVSAWVRAKTTCPRHAAIQWRVSSTNPITQDRWCYIVPNNYWQRVMLYAQCTDDWASQENRFGFIIRLYGGTGTEATYQFTLGNGDLWTDTVLYIDDVQIAYSDDLWPDSSWQPSSVPRPDETASATLSGLSSNWSVFWTWHPETSSRCVPANGRMDLGYITNAGGDEINVWYDANSVSEGFVFSDKDGVPLVKLEPDDESRFYFSEDVKFGISHSGSKTDFYVQTSGSDIKTDTVAATSCVTPTTITLGTTGLTSPVHGTGMISGLVTYDIYLTSTQVEYVFDDYTFMPSAKVLIRTRDRDRLNDGLLNTNPFR